MSEQDNQPKERTVTADQLIKILKTANGEQLAEIRRLLGVPAIQYVPQPYPSTPCPILPPFPPDLPYESWPKVTCVSGPTVPMAESRLGEVG